MSRKDDTSEEQSKVDPKVKQLATVLARKVMRPHRGWADAWDLAAEPWMFPFIKLKRHHAVNLIVDGWLSRSDRDHFAVHHIQNIAKIDHLRCLLAKAFSYYKPGHGYSAAQTTSSIETHISKLRDLLIKLQSGTKVVITAFSMGGPITVLTLCRLLDENPSLREIIPLVILVNPAMSGSIKMLDIIEAGGIGFTEQSMPIVHELMDSHGDYPQQARTGIKSLLDAGIAIVTLYSNDAFVPYEDIGDCRAYEIDLTGKDNDAGQGAAAGTADAFSAHANVIKIPKYHRWIYAWSKPVVSSVLWSEAEKDVEYRYVINCRDEGD